MKLTLHILDVKKRPSLTEFLKKKLIKTNQNKILMEID